MTSGAPPCAWSHLLVSCPLTGCAGRSVLPEPKKGMAVFVFDLGLSWLCALPVMLLEGRRWAVSSWPFYLLLSLLVGPDVGLPLFFCRVHEKGLVTQPRLHPAEQSRDCAVAVHSESTGRPPRRSGSWAWLYLLLAFVGVGLRWCLPPPHALPCPCLASPSLAFAWSAQAA